MHKALPVLAALATSTSTAFAQTLTPDTTSRVDAVFARFSPTTPGCALNVLRGGSSIYGKSYGLASLELGVPISTHTVFDIGSTSKQFTAASIVLLAQDGKLSLDDDIRKFIPELPDLGAKVTLRHLLNHTSGWRDYVDLMALGGFDDRDHTTDADAMAVLRRQKSLNFTPGSDWRYSNTGFFLMSVVVRRVANKSLADFARERIFEPLGMKSTHYLTESREVIPNKATAYSPVPGGGFLIAMSDWEQIGDGGVQTTVEDLARWDANFDTPTVGGMKMVDALQTTATLSNGTPLTYALGLTVDQYRGVRRVSHGGAWGGFRAMTMRFPAQRLAVLTLCNRADANTDQLASGVANVFLPAASSVALAGAAPVAPVPGEAATYSGWYYADGTGQLIDLEAHGDTLVTAGNGQPLQPLGGGRFRHSSGSSFHLSVDRIGKSLVIEPAGAGAPTPFRRVEPAGAVKGAELVGHYASDEMPGDWEVSVRGDSLFVHPPRAEETRMQPLFRDAFGGAGIMRFVRDASGKVTAFTLTTRGIHELRLTRR